VLQNRRAKHAGKMRTAFTPVETWATVRAPIMIERVYQNTRLAKHNASGVRYDTAIRRQFDHTGRDKPVSDGDPKFAGDMVVACPRPLKRRIDPGSRPANICSPL